MEFSKPVVIWRQVVIQLCTLYLQKYVQERHNVKEKIVAFVLLTDQRPLRLATNVCSRARAQQAFIWRLDLLKVGTQTSDVGHASPGLQGKSRNIWLAIYVRSILTPDSVKVADGTEENAGNVKQPDTSLPLWDVACRCRLHRRQHHFDRQSPLRYVQTIEVVQTHEQTQMIIILENVSVTKVGCSCPHIDSHIFSVPV